MHPLLNKVKHITEKYSQRTAIIDKDDRHCSYGALSSQVDHARAILQKKERAKRDEGFGCRAYVH